jgi:putative ABC transport system permease protein
MHSFAADLRYALRTMAKTPGLTLVIVLSLAIGIGANTAIFSVVNALLLKPLPYPQADRLVELWLRSPGLGIPRDWPSPGQYTDIVTQNHSFETVSISHGGNATITGLERPERVGLLQTSSNLFSLLGAKPLLGRLFTPSEDAPGGAEVAILSHEAWQRLFSGDPRILGRTILVGRASYTVVGVLRPDFLLNREIMPTVGGIGKMDVYARLPLGSTANQYGDENYNLMARLKPGVTPERAQADIDIIARRIRESKHRDPTFTISVVPLLEQVVGNVRNAVLVLFGSVALVLLIACANVANLLLSRATARQKEVAIRTALGAGWSRVMRQLLSESLLLGIAGGIAGLGIAYASLWLVRTINPGNIPRLEFIRIDGAVLAFTFAAAVLTGLLFGLAPAIRSLNMDLNSPLKAGGRSGQGESGLGFARGRLRGLLVVSELALSLMLLIGAGLLARSFVRIQAVPPGFNPDHVMSMALGFPPNPRYKDRKARIELGRQLREGIAGLPGVIQSGGGDVLPLTESVSWGGMQIEGYTPPPGQPELQVDQRSATPGYFETMEIPLKQGRFFTPHDTPDSQHVAIVDEKMAHRFWPAGDAIGKRIGGDPKDMYTIVGIVGVVKQYGLDTDTRMVVYFPDLGIPDWVVARTVGDPNALSAAMARVVHAAESQMPIYDVRTMQDRLYDSLARQRFAMVMLGAFAVFAMILAAIGVYGTISYLVTQSLHDIGVRIALGASRGAILRMVVRRGMDLAVAGIALGLIGAFALTRVMATLLFGVSERDAATFTAVPAFLAVVALAACYIPALRATRVDPMIALREE